MEVTKMDERINKMLGMLDNNNVEGFLNDIDQMGASKAYLVIRDNITQQHIKKIKDSGKENYQKFQDIKMRAKESWDYDHKMANMADVNRACMNVYTLVLKLMRAQNGDFAEELNKIQSAINRIEEKVGLDPTAWEIETESDNGGTNDADNVQGVEENI
jgi:hypothetical protein